VILVLSLPDDAHARAVLGFLHQRGEESGSTIGTPTNGSVAIGFHDRDPPSLTLRFGTEPLDLVGVSATWWRRPQAPSLGAIGDPNARWFAASEWSEVLAGLWLLLGGRWMNEPALDERASHKPYQLRVAAEVGLVVPKTLMTSDPGAARAFVDEVGLERTIFKTFAATQTVWRETRLVREPEVELLDAVRLAPDIFQEYGEADADVRVTVVGHEIFAVAIDARGTDYSLDFRMSLGQTRTSPAILPRGVVRKVRALMKRLGLAYGAIDMRRTPSGEYVFLEINPAGEFLFAQDHGGQPIAEAVATWLAGRP
jgi:hypothetical protein